MAPSPSPPGPRQRPQQPLQPRRRANVANNIEDQVRYAYYTPSPGSYDPYDPRKPDPVDPKRLGKISDARVPSALDHEPRTKGYVPGPGSYVDDRKFALPEGGRLNRNPPPERFKIDEYPVPAPGNYGVPGNPANPRTINGRFSRDPKVSKYIQDEVVRSRSIPGPGAHDVMESMEMSRPFCPEGGRCLMSSKPASYFDKAPTLSEGNPEPGQYNLQGSVQPNKSVGRLVYRYESATMAESRELMNKVMGDREEAPGPGAYDLPEPPPLAGVPVLKGRALPHGMPHPYAYNCAPDLARNFEALAPVRQQNSASQIYGNGVRPGDSAAAAARRARKNSRPSSAGSGDHVQAHELPERLQGVEEEVEGAVQWRSGGFAPIKKAKSTSAIPRPEHPAVQHARKSYKLLSGKHRENSTFRPMAAKKAESVSTHEASEVNQRLRRGKWQLAALAEGIQNATAAALEPLDLEKLKQEGMEGLRDKARERMRLEGISQQQQSLVLQEMTSILEERRRASTQASASLEAEQAGSTAEGPAAAPEALVPAAGGPGPTLAT